MTNKLFLIEGIPGAGKTTTARKKKEELESCGYKVNLYEEGMSHPADCSWQAYFTEQEYKEFKQKSFEMWNASDKTISKEELEKRIDEQARREENHVLLAYTRIRFPEDCYWSLAGLAASKELCDGRSSFDEFKQIHLKRWKRFTKEAIEKDEINLFECAFLQNHIFELMGVYEKADEEIYTYLQELIQTVSKLNPVLIYLEPNNIKKVISQAAKERKAPNPSQKDWIDEIADWVSNSNYGKHHRLMGTEGVIQFCKERMRLDKLVLEKLDIPVIYIRRD